MLLLCTVKIELNPSWAVITDGVGDCCLHSLLLLWQTLQGIRTHPNTIVNWCMILLECTKLAEVNFFKIRQFYVIEQLNVTLLKWSYSYVGSMVIPCPGLCEWIFSQIKWKPLSCLDIKVILWHFLLLKCSFLQEGKNT